MSTYKLTEDDFSKVDWETLFEEYPFFKMHSNKSSAYLRWLKDDEPIGSIHFTSSQEKGVWRSPIRGTYAGYSFSSDVTLEEMISFHYAVENYLIGKEVQSIELLLPPIAHNPVKISNIIYMLISVGFQISRCDLNQTISISDENFTKRVSYGNLKRIKKCIRNGFICRQQQFNQLRNIFEVLTENRRAKGNELSMSWTQLNNMVVEFPEQCLLFSCEKDGEIIAGAFCIKLNNNILYVFYWGDKPGYESHSPTVHLAGEIYKYCQQKNIALLDIGTSTIGTLPNFGLLNFKRGLGFSESLKFRMIKDIAK